MPDSCSKIKEKQQTKRLDAQHQRRHLNSLDVVMWVYDPSTWEVEAEGWRFLGQPEPEQ